MFGVGLPGKQDDDDDTPVWSTRAVGTPSLGVRDVFTSIPYVFTGEQGRAPREPREAWECD
jgi:hypothetical protein